MARVGLLSDSHGREAITRQGVALLVRHGAEVLIHLGDVGSVEVIDALLVPAPGPELASDSATRDVRPETRDSSLLPAHLVFGNTDHDFRELARYATRVGVTVDHPVGCLAFGDKNLIFLHGHDPEAMRRALASGPAYLCHGHTHVRADERVERTRVINPGALHRAAAYTVALLDTATDQLTFHTVAARRSGG